MKTKIKNFLFSVAKNIFFPQKEFIAFFLRFAATLQKIASFERSRLFSKLFEHYFAQIEKAKKEKREAEIKINFEEVGATLTYLSTNISTAIVCTLVLYTIFIYVVSIAAPMFVEFSSIEELITILLGTLGIMYFYYLIMMIIVVKKYVLTKYPNQYFLKIQIENELAYIYQKAKKIDEEVADLTVYHLSNSLLLQAKDTKKDETKFKNILKGL